MNNIVRFNSYFEYENYIRFNISNICLGHGSDGICFLGLDGFVYKIFHRDFYDNNHNALDVVTISDVNLDSFALPINIFCVGDNVVGYTTKYVSRDLFFNNYFDCGYLYKLGRTSVSYTKDTVVNIILNELIKVDSVYIKRAYRKLFMDTNNLSNVGIRINGLCDKILFDGKNFVVVDTFSYTKGNNDVSFFNNQLIENAFRDEMSYLYYFVSNNNIDKEMDLNDFIDKIWDDFVDIYKKDVKKKSKR